MKRSKLKRGPLNIILLTFLSVMFVVSALTTLNPGQPINICSDNSCQTTKIKLSTCAPNSNCCGNGADEVQTSINFGCYGNKCTNTKTATGDKYCSGNHNPIIDLLFAIIRFLSDGVGIVIIASVIVGGIQYIVSRGDPNSTQAAIRRLTSALTALFVFIFAWSFLQFIVPDFLK